MEISIEKLVIADPTIVDANPDIEENEGSDNEEAVAEPGEAGTAPKKRKKKKNRKPKGTFYYRDTYELSLLDYSFSEDSFLF